MNVVAPSEISIVNINQYIILQDQKSMMSCIFCFRKNERMMPIQCSFHMLRRVITFGVGPFLKRLSDTIKLQLTSQPIDKTFLKRLSYFRSTYTLSNGYISIALWF